MTEVLTCSNKRCGAVFRVESGEKAHKMCPDCRDKKRTAQNKWRAKVKKEKGEEMEVKRRVQVQVEQETKALRDQLYRVEAEKNSKLYDASYWRQELNKVRKDNAQLQRRNDFLEKRGDHLETENFYLRNQGNDEGTA
jgi:hypothetical protein